MKLVLGLNKDNPPSVGKLAGGLIRNTPRKEVLRMSSLSDIDNISKMIKEQPKSQWFRLCRQFGIHSPDNARHSSRFQMFKLNSEKRKEEMQRA